MHETLNLCYASANRQNSKTVGHRDSRITIGN